MRRTLRIVLALLVLLVAGAVIYYVLTQRSRAIRLTGIEPPPSRFIVASVVILLYTSLLPPLVLFLNYVQMSRGAHPLP